MYKKRGISKLVVGRKSKASQIWVETVIYTLIGLAIIAALLAVVSPKVKQMNDRAVISQTINSLGTINEEINNVLESPGSSRHISLTVKRGEYIVDGINDSFYYYIEDLNYAPSQINMTVKNGDLTMLTLEKNNKYNLYLILNYSYLNITYQDKDIVKTVTQAPTAYDLLIENIGGNDKRLNIRLL